MPAIIHGDPQDTVHEESTLCESKEYIPPSTVLENYWRPAFGDQKTRCVQFTVGNQNILKGMRLDGVAAYPVVPFAIGPSVKRRL
jgi:hypothetical protein